MQRISGRCYANSEGFILSDLIAQGSDGNLEVASSAGPTSAMIGERAEDELALDIFYCVADKPRNDQSVKAAGKRRSGHGYLRKAHSAKRIGSHELPAPRIRLQPYG